ncbi:hypothetical protein [Niabella sp.]|uniref:hypothetical protein n=1 Tax=Niabella sp. TaxID=1962976 RepID=UPI0026094278|nr:hypothetical protein [Niabella sp.]
MERVFLFFNYFAANYIGATIKKQRITKESPSFSGRPIAYICSAGIARKPFRQLLMKRLVLSLIAFAAITSIHAQEKNEKAIGIRISSHVDYATLAASYKFYISEAGAIELNAGFGHRNRYSTDDYHYWNTTGISLSGAYQHHFDIVTVPGLKWFLGGGLLVFNSFSKQKYYDGFGAGILADGGIDYKFSNTPLNLSADFRPVLHIAAPSGFGTLHAHTFGLAARYTFR